MALADRIQSVCAQSIDQQISLALSKGNMTHPNLLHFFSTDDQTHNLKTSKKNGQLHSSFISQSINLQRHFSVSFVIDWNQLLEKSYRVSNRIIEKPDYGSQGLTKWQFISLRTWVKINQKQALMRYIRNGGIQRKWPQYLLESISKKKTNVEKSKTAF